MTALSCLDTKVVVVLYRAKAVPFLDMDYLFLMK
mgnify:CR=1 FL=1